MTIEERRAQDIYNQVKKYLFDKKNEIKFRYNKKDCELPYLTTDEIFEETGYAEFKVNGNVYTVKFARRHLKDNDGEVCLSPSLYIELCAVYNGELFTMWEMKSEKRGYVYKTDATSSSFPFKVITERKIKSDDIEIKEVF